MAVHKHRPFNISIVGSGNVAWHLAHAFVRQKHEINTIISRNSAEGKTLAKEVRSMYSDSVNLMECNSDFVVLAVDDSGLAELAGKMVNEDIILLHTSGSMDIEVFNLSQKKYGVLYPFQTLTKGIYTDLSKVPFCIEASDESVLQNIHELASSLSNNIYTLPSEGRRILHLSGVISNNFINHLIALTFDYLEKQDLDKELIMPLLKETLRKLENASPRKAQTGPARRKNTEIIETHKKLLKDEPELKNLYSLISDSIIAYYS